MLTKAGRRRNWSGIVCVVGLFVVVSLMLCARGPAWAEDGLAWSKWEQKHAVAHKEDWLVIREPGRDECYLKQGYAGERMMDLTVDENGSPCLWGAFSDQPVDVLVSYEIDDLKEGEFTAWAVTNGIRLPRELVSSMRRGFSLLVELESLDPEKELGTVRKQKFSLLGFIAATEVLDTKDCQE